MRLALIGAESRSALAFRDFLDRHAPDVKRRLFARREVASGHGERDEIARVDRYQAIVADDLKGCEAAVHFVGAVNAESEEALHALNAELPRQIARAAHAAGVRQFVQFSSLSIYGRQPLVGCATPPTPASAYGRSKLAAEEMLEAERGKGMTVALMRIPMVYGFGWDSKLNQLAGLMRKLPLFPAPSVLPCRSIISSDNLCRAIWAVVSEGADGPLFAADPGSFRLDLMARILGVRLVRLPALAFAPLRLAAPGVYASLFETMEIDAASLYRPADWPLISVEESLRAIFSGEN